MVVPVGLIDRRQRVVAEHAVLGREHGDRAPRVPEEQAVVAHAQPEQDVELRARLGEQPRLPDRVAHALELARRDLVVVGQAEDLLGQRTRLAGDGLRPKTVRLEHPLDHGGLVLQPDAVREAEPRVAAARAKSMISSMRVRRQYPAASTRAACRASSPSVLVAVGAQQLVPVQIAVGQLPGNGPASPAQQAALPQSEHSYIPGSLPVSAVGRPWSTAPHRFGSSHPTGSRRRSRLHALRPACIMSICSLCH